MRKIILIIAVIFCSTVLSAQTGQIKLTISNIEKTDGTIKIAVFNKEEGFPAPENACYHKDIAVSESKLTVTFDDIPAGIYAISLVHDLNNDGILNKKKGRPAEPTGFSQNKRGKFGPPSFKEVSFKVIENNCSSVNISLFN